MGKTNSYSKLIDAYFSLIENLSEENKLKLIEKLSSSTKLVTNGTKSMKSFYGIWKSEKSAEDIISEIYSARTAGRKIEKL
ncbi:MAG: hypothetical protein ABI792_00695 [bacterium]